MMFRRMVHTVALSLMVTAALSSRVHAQAWSIQQFQAAKAEWEKLVDTPMQVEGRLSSVLKNQLRLQKCDLSFTMTEELARLAANAKNLELTGRLRKDGNRLTFEVSNLKSMPTDIEQFQTKELAIKQNQPEEWYALGEWARERGEFYDDAALKESSQLCLTRGVGYEARALAPDDREGRLKLADKAAHLKLPVTVIQSLRHDAFRRWWQQAVLNHPQESEELAALEKRMSTVWPEALRPLANWPGELADTYTKDPLTTFAEADPLEQRQLQRVFGVHVQLRRITRDAADDGRNGSEIADRLAKAIPEQPQLAERYRDKELAYRLNHIATASRQEAVSLSEQFRQRERPDVALDTLRKWLAAREKERTTQADAPTLIALADDYRQWLKDDAKAASLLIAAHRLEPLSEDVQTRLTDLGYELQGGRWNRATPSKPDEPLPPPGFDAPIAVGMTAEELTRQIGQPSKRTVIATIGGIDEWWTFGSGSGSHLLIQLQRRRNDSQAKVVRFENR